MARLSHLPVISDVLFIDIDKGDAEVEAVKQALITMGVAFEQWHTGRRGGHFHIPIKLMQGADVPYSQKMWVQSTFPDWGADLSIYTHTGQWRLPYTVHEKNPGHVKQLILDQPGTLLEIPMLARPVLEAAEPNSNLDVRMEWLENLTRVRGSGQRSPHLYILCCNAHELGLSYEDALRDILRWNAQYVTPPHDERYIAAKVHANLMQLTVRGPHGRQGQRNPVPGAPPTGRSDSGGP